MISNMKIHTKKRNGEGASARLLRFHQVRELVGNPSRTTVWRWCRDGNFPRPIRLSSGLIAWREKAVLEWVESREESAEYGTRG